jgi:hypothetical protein
MKWLLVCLDRIYVTKKKKQNLKGPLPSSFISKKKTSLTPMKKIENSINKIQEKKISDNKTNLSSQKNI